MEPLPSPLAITRDLIGIDSTNPQGGEQACADYLEALLRGGGLAVRRLDLAPGRPNLLASLPGRRPGPPLCLCGHLDTVPLGGTPWSRAPLGAQVEGDKLYGRGASDMKSGLAAMAHALLRLAAQGGAERDVLLLLCADEEDGCGGSTFLVGQKALPNPLGALIVAEPTGNQPWLGHKGALWLRAHYQGRAAHGSMPELGDNAVYKAARAATRLEAWRPQGPAHLLLGQTTLNLGTLHGGTRVNMVPDQASLELDLRTLPGQDHQELTERMRELLGQPAGLETLTSTPGFWTPAQEPFARLVYDVVEELSGLRPQDQGGRYFTDAGVLHPALGQPPAILLGPGEPTQAHQTDEWCLVANIAQAAEMYHRIASAWRG